jgi:hypothetical protein
MPDSLQRATDFHSPLLIDQGGGVSGSYRTVQVSTHALAHTTVALPALITQTVSVINSVRRLLSGDVGSFAQ